MCGMCGCGGKRRVCVWSVESVGVSGVCVCVECVECGGEECVCVECVECVSSPGPN